MSSGFLTKFCEALKPFVPDRQSGRLRQNDQLGHRTSVLCYQNLVPIGSTFKKFAQIRLKLFHGSRHDVDLTIRASEVKSTDTSPLPLIDTALCPEVASAHVAAAV